nr:MAG TPA: hypothetical protein [Microviridae sp.]
MNASRNWKRITRNRKTVITINRELGHKQTTWRKHERK